MTASEHPSTLGLRSTLVGIVVNISLAVVKGLAGILGNSYALIADAIESTSDIFTSLIVYGALKISAKPRDKDHPYGHGKAEPLAAMAVAVALLVAAITIIVQSLKEIQTPHHAPAPFTLGVLIVVVLIKETLFRKITDVGESIKSTAVKNDAWHHRSDAVTSLACAIGIGIALLGGPGYETADDWAALFASGIIIFNAIRLFIPGLQEIMDQAPDPEIEREIREIANTVTGVITIEKCFVRKMGFDFFVDLHVHVDGLISVQDGHAIGHQVKDAIKAGNPRIVDVLIHVEPEEKSH